MNMIARRRGPLASLLLSAVFAGACASGGGVPRPQPFPGAPAPHPPSTDAVREPGTLAEGTWPPVVATALTLRGIPYRDGGSEPSRGFDCSGLVQWVFAQHGTALPRQAHEQFEEGAQVELGQVQPGDLVFFKTQGRTVSHVGIALGDGTFVHAPNSRGVVRVERYTGPYWLTRLAGVRRIVATGTAATD